MARAADSHADDESIANYTIGHLPPKQLAQVEEHLLICGPCRQRLTEADSYAAAMRAAVSNCAIPSARPGVLAALQMLPLSPKTRNRESTR